MAESICPHPSKEQLRAFGSGQLDSTDSEAIERHVAQCSVCCDDIKNLGNDSFVNLVRDCLVSGETHEGPAARMEVPKDLLNHPRYRVLEWLGAGGMGTVFKAEHRMMRRLVALKVINPRLVDRPALVDRFQREVRATASLAHPNIVTAFDAEQAGQTHFLVMEFVEGRTLAQVVNEEGPLPVGVACAYIRQVARGLEHAHRRAMTHRDIKPQNLMLTAEGQVKILDFGLARFARESHPEEGLHDPSHTDPGTGPITEAGCLLGTADYIPPEQTRDARQADIRGDVYSLGCTLYFLLAGRPPFPEGAAAEKLIAHREQIPPLLADLRQDIPAEVETLIRRMMAKDPAQRFQTPAEVVAALGPFVDGSWRSRARLFVRRRMRALVAAILLCSVLGFGFALGWDRLAGLFSPTPQGDGGVEQKVPGNGKQVKKPGPTIRPNTELHISVPCRGENPATVERLVADSLEKKLRELAGITQVQSRSSATLLQLTLSFASETARKNGAARAEGILADWQKTQPPWVGPAGIDNYSPDDLPILWLALRSDRHSKVEISEYFWENTLRRLQDVSAAAGDLEFWGNSKRSLETWLFPNKLAAHNLTTDDVGAAMEKAKIKFSRDSGADLRNIIIRKGKDRDIFLRDVGEFRDAINTTSFAILDGPCWGVAVGVHPYQGASLTETVAAMYQAREALRHNLREGMTLEMIPDFARVAKELPEVLLVELRFPATDGLDTIEEKTRELGRFLWAVLEPTKKPSCVERTLAIGPLDLEDPYSVRIVLPLLPPSKRLLTVDEVSEAIRQVGLKLPEVKLRIVNISGPMLPPRPTYPVRLALEGDAGDFTDMTQWAQEIIKQAGGESSGLIDVAAESIMARGRPRIVADKKKAAEAGFEEKPINDRIAMATGASNVFNIKLPYEAFPGDDQATYIRERLGGFPIYDKQGRMIPLAPLVGLETDSASIPLLRVNGKRVIDITANPAPGTTVEGARENLRKIAEAARPKSKVQLNFRIVVE